MVKYSNSSIYKLCCKDIAVTEVYVGSTTNFKRRKCCHKSSCVKVEGIKYNYNIYQFIRNNGGWVNWSMIEIEKYPATDKRHLETRERYWIDTLKPVLNKNVPTRTDKEYRNDTKEESKAYRQENKEKLDNYFKERYANNIERERETRRQYYHNNEAKLKEKHNCECGGKYTTASKAKHFKTDLHKHYQAANLES